MNVTGRWTKTFVKLH